MKPYSLIVISFLVLVSLIMVPVSATTLSGSLSTTGNTQVFWNTSADAANAMKIAGIYMKEVQYSAGTETLVDFPQVVMTFTTGAPASETTTFTGKWGGTGNDRFAGTIGYQRVWNALGVEQPGYCWIWFSQYNVSGITGDGYVALTMNTTKIHDMQIPTLKNTYAWMSNGQIAFDRGGSSMPGNYSSIKTTNFNNDWTATYPSGIGITGTITKTVGGTAYGSKAHIINAISRQVLTSDSAVNTDNFNFSVPAQTGGIIIALQDSYTLWHNTSAISAPATPTITNSPTPGPTTMEPGTWSNITFTTRYGVNSTVIPNVFTKLYMYHEGGGTGDDDWTQAVDGYTDSNGQITFSQVDLDGWDFRVEFTKPDLYQLDFWVTPSQFTYSLPVYMYVQPANSEIPGFPTTINLTVQVKNAQTFAAIPSAWVTVGDDISGTTYVGQSTNATGYVVFPGIPNTANINGVISKVGYTPLTYWVTSGSLLGGDVAITKYLYLSSVTVTPTITPVPQEGITFVANPNSVAPGQSTTLTVTCANVTACTGAGGMSVVTYSEKYPDTSWDTHLIRAYKWNATRSYYDWKNNPNDAWTATGTFNGLTATGTPTISGTNTYYVNLMRTDSFAIGSANVGVLVTGAVAGNLIMKLWAGDQTTGAHLYNYQMNLTNRNTGATTEFNTVVYDVNKLLPRGQDYTVQCSKGGYLPGTNDFTVPTNPNIVDGDMGTFVSCPLYPTGSISAGNTTVTVKVFDAENYIPLPNVQVQMSAPIIYSDSPKYTGGDGSGAFFILGQNQPYSVTASKSGYCAVTDTGNTSTLDTKNVYLNLKYGSCMGPTPTPTPTPGPTGTGGPGVIVTPTTFQAGNATTFWRPWINVFNMMGANAGEINMLLAGLIIVLLMAVGGGVAGVLGAEVFMGFGAIFCVAVGLIPIWVVLAIIILGFLFYGLKIGR